MQTAQIAEIIALYKKHGWELRRVLLSASLRGRLADELAALFGDADVRESDIDAAWFARPPKNGEETWELRRLSETGYALNEFFDEEDDDEIREEAFAEVESRLRDASK